jgi:chemotaxis methyl-accepting protein methylase
MKINQSNLYKPFFGTSNRQVRKNSYGKIIASDEKDYNKSGTDTPLYANTTMFFRYDLNTAHTNKHTTDGTWKGFRRTIIDNFKNAPKVNVYDFASSDGSEAYSFILSLLDELGEKEAQKFFPIQAYDIDSKMVSIAQGGLIPCDYDDVKRFLENINEIKNQKYYNINFAQSGYTPYFFEANDKLKNKVRFNQASIQSMIDSIEPSNSLVLCRNFWPYLETKDVYETIWKLGEKLDDSSLLVIGYFDKF